MALKLGTLQERLLRYLALHPKQNAQVVQRGLGVPDKNYPSIKKALETLRKQGLVKTLDAKSKKNVPIKLWLLADEGLKYVFINSHIFAFTKEELETLIENYVEGGKVKEVCKIMIRDLGSEVTLRMLSAYFSLVSSKTMGNSDIAQIMVLSSVLKDTKLENNKVEKFITDVLSMTPELEKAKKAFGMLRRFLKTISKAN